MSCAPLPKLISKKQEPIFSYVNAVPDIDFSKGENHPSPISKKTGVLWGVLKNDLQFVYRIRASVFFRNLFVEKFSSPI